MKQPQKVKNSEAGSNFTNSHGLVLEMNSDDYDGGDGNESVDF